MANLLLNQGKIRWRPASELAWQQISRKQTPFPLELNDFLLTDDKSSGVLQISDPPSEIEIPPNTILQIQRVSGKINLTTLDLTTSSGEISNQIEDSPETEQDHNERQNTADEKTALPASEIEMNFYPADQSYIFILTDPQVRVGLNQRCPDQCRIEVSGQNGIACDQVFQRDSAVTCIIPAEKISSETFHLKISTASIQVQGVFTVEKFNSKNMSLRMNQKMKVIVQ